MLTIRQEQMDALSRVALDNFGDRMVVHLKKCFPESCRALGELGTREAIRHGTERAGSYRLTAERDVCRYIDVMLAFGRDFDADPSLPWAAEILGDEGPAGPGDKMDRLVDEAQNRADQARGIAVGNAEAIQ